MSWALLAVIGLLVWVLATVLIDAYLRRQPRQSLSDRLWPYRTLDVADEAECWLKDR